jgi:hypothetical protein
MFHYKGDIKVAHKRPPGETWLDFWVIFERRFKNICWKYIRSRMTLRVFGFLN